MAKRHITRLYPRDVRAFSALARCGHVTQAQLKSCGLRDKRIYGYQRDGLVKKCVYSRPGNNKANDVICFKLTDKGRNLCRNELSMPHIYGAQSPKHDLALSERYFSLSDSERSTWRTEGELRDAFREHIRQLEEQGEQERAQELLDKLQERAVSMPDASYTTETGVDIAYEIVTNNYGEAEIESKETAAEELGLSIEFQRV